MTTYPLPVNTRAVGTADPPGDMNKVVDLLSAITGITPGGSLNTASAPVLKPVVTGGTTSSPLTVAGSSAAGQLVYLEQDGSTDHVLTLNLVGTGGATNAALNAVSANPGFSAVEVTGTETAHGTVKIAHQGYADASDASAAAVSIDLQTTVGGATGTAAQGIFITSTTDAVPGGNALTVRYNSKDWFVVKGNVAAGSGVVGIGVATGHVPAGMLEIAQKDTTTPGLNMTALASGTDMVQLKDSGGNLRFQVNNSGNVVTRANALISTSMQVGSVSASLGGGGSGVIGITDTGTVPTSGVTGGGTLYSSGGHLFWRSSTSNSGAGTAVQLA
ncbi:MAG: hypothetical protein J2P30_00525 [Actinobacteria bacterium]|nr:hypothetical protein [Actinomycetota bacterium]